jgi:hypothetical protein
MQAVFSAAWRVTPRNTNTPSKRRLTPSKNKNCTLLINRISWQGDDHTGWPGRYRIRSLVVRRLKTPARQSSRIFFDVAPSHDRKVLRLPLLALDPASALRRHGVADDVLARRPLSHDFGRKRSRSGERQQPAQHRVALHLAQRVEAAKRHLGSLAISPEPQRPRLAAAGLNDQPQAPATCVWRLQPFHTRQQFGDARGVRVFARGNSRVNG